MRVLTEKNIAKVSFFYSIIIVAVMTFSTGALFIVKKINTLEKDLVRIEQDFLSEQRTSLENDVAELVSRIEFRRLEMKAAFEKRLQKRVEEALLIAENIYDSMNESLSDEDIRYLIREAIRPIRFNEHEGYFFIIGPDGEAILYPVNPAIEGTNFLTNEIGEISNVQLKAEPAIDGHITFKRTPNSIDVEKETLNKYVGSYFMGAVEIKVYTKKETTLYLFVQGQPEYELIATDKHKFSFKSLEGFKVEFLESDDKAINEVLVIQPNGSFKAKRKLDDE